MSDTAIALVILGIVFMLVFHKPITGFLKQMKHVKAGPIEAGAGPQLPASEAKNALDEVMRTFDSPLLVEQEEHIRKDLRARSLTAPDDREKSLVRALASTQIGAAFVLVHTAIFRSQVDLLNYLNPRTATPTPISEAEPFYEEGRARTPSNYETRSFAEWLEFLVASQLVLRQADTIVITERGRGYLRFVVDSGLPTSPNA